MDHIETAILNCYGIREAEQNMVFAARLTQHGHTIQNMADLMDLYRQSYSQKTVENIAGLPHPTVQKFMVITVAVVGASRRFLAQITRHQNEVKYMSAWSEYLIWRKNKWYNQSLRKWAADTNGKANTFYPALPYHPKRNSR